jgi:transcriptional regulator with XRE-family HTH domain
MPRSARSAPLPVVPAALPAAGAPPDQRRLGEVLREARVRAGLTLQEVAGEAEISTSALSKIENGQVEVKFATLMRLSAALSLSLAHLAGPAAPLRVAGARVVTRRDSGVPHSIAQYDYALMATDLAAKSMLPSVITIKARSLDEFPEWNRHVGEEFLYVLRGALRLYMEGYEPVLLEAGDGVYYDSSIGHALVAAGRGPVQVLSVASDPGAGRHAAVRHPE